MSLWQITHLLRQMLFTVPDFALVLIWIIFASAPPDVPPRAVNAPQIRIDSIMTIKEPAGRETPMKLPTTAINRSAVAKNPGTVNIINRMDANLPTIAPSAAKTPAWAETARIPEMIPNTTGVIQKGRDGPNVISMTKMPMKDSPKATVLLYWSAFFR